MFSERFFEIQALQSFGLQEIFLQLDQLSLESLIYLSMFLLK